MDYLMLTFEIIGTIAFAVSGSGLALKKNMDIFGVCVMGLITACGGGIMRDLFLGRFPPFMFRHPIYAFVSVVASVILFLPYARGLLAQKKHAYERVLLITDSLGLGIFTAAGVAATVSAGFGDNLFLAVFLGTITGVGGGVIRDMMAGLPPYIFVKHIYACAAIAGAILCGLLYRLTGLTWAMLACCALVMVIRLLAAKYRWSLPKAGERRGTGKA